MSTESAVKSITKHEMFRLIDENLLLKKICSPEEVNKGESSTVGRGTEPFMKFVERTLKRLTESGLERIRERISEQPSDRIDVRFVTVILLVELNKVKKHKPDTSLERQKLLLEELEYRRLMFEQKSDGAMLVK